MVGPNGSLSEARIGATVVGLPGQMMFAGDKLGELAPERMWLLQRCLPVCDVRPLDLFPIYTPKPIWVLKVKRPFAEWNVVSLFNFSDREKQRFCLRPRDIGLEPDREYLVHDYWNRRLMRKLREKVEFTLKPKSNLLLAVHESLGRPQFTSTDRHVTQGGTSIETLQWDESSLTLRGRTRLVGGETTTMSFYVPAGFAFGKAVSRDAKAAALLTHRNRVLELSLSSVRSRCAGWKLLFKRPEGGRRGR